MPGYRSGAHEAGSEVTLPSLLFWLGQLMVAAQELAAGPGSLERGSVRLRLFGPLEVFDQRQVLEVGPPQRQAVLAALAVDANAAVPVELLMDRVWGRRPPDGARAALHAHITRLRRVLTGTRAVPVRLERRNSGYVLEIDRDQVDLHRFQRLLDHARELGEDDERRVRLLREAITIWRGPPLANVPGDWALRVRAGIETQFISAAVMWAQAELRAGHADAAVDKLGQLSSLYPLSEPLAAALMRALCGAGRRAEALQHYVTISVHLREELGAEPGNDLRTLHTAILRGQLAQPHPGPVGPAAYRRYQPRQLPRQLPATTTGFTGRQRELAAITAAFPATAPDGSTPVVAINGYGGVGKSALAIHAAHRLVARFPDGQLYANLHGHDTAMPPTDPARLLNRFLRALGVPPEDCPTDREDAAGLFRTLTADRRLLVVLDNARSATQVRQLSPGAPGCGLLVTSRRILAGLDGANHIHLDVLAEPAAISMLRQMVGAARVIAEPEATAAVARCCGYLPLALRAAGARLAARPGWRIATLAHRLKDRSGRLDELDVAELSVRHSFAASYQELADSVDATDRGAASIFAWLGSQKSPERSGGETAQQLGHAVEDTERLLERLVDARLLESPAPGRYRLPALLQLYASETPAT